MLGALRRRARRRSRALAGHRLLLYDRSITLRSLFEPQQCEGSAMARNPRFDVLFEPVRIGPVTAPNRFYQVPHASGMTNSLPQVRASFRETKAEGGWGVVCTGAVSIHPSSDDSPLPFAILWDDKDIRSHALMTDAVHRHGALAGIELWHGGACTLNRTSRMAPLSPSGMPWLSTHLGFMGNLRPRTMDTADIQDLLRWQAAGARRAMQAGFDIVYVYAGMGYLPYEFLLPEYNRRTDAYGGSIENRVRLVRELLDVTRDAVGDKCAVALRISMEELRGRPGRNAVSEAHEVVALLADVPDLWDVKMDSSPTDCAPSRFSPEGSHEPIVNFVKQLTKRPVVGVGRFTSPDVMVSQVRRGILDLIGGARPSIADPFLPKKIDEGREHEIRECIGCNICISSWHDGVPVRCTQNPTAGEEWRRGWHPERFAPPASDAIRPDRGRRSGRPRVRHDARAPRLYGDDRRLGQGIRRPIAFRNRACRDSRPGAALPTGAWVSCATGRTSTCIPAARWVWTIFWDWNTATSSSRPARAGPRCCFRPWSFRSANWTGRPSTRPMILPRVSCRRVPWSCSISTTTTWPAPLPSSWPSPAAM